MAEKLPGLIDPNLPADQQPLYDTTQSESRATRRRSRCTRIGSRPAQLRLPASEQGSDSTTKLKPKSPSAAPSPTGSAPGSGAGPARSKIHAAVAAEESIAMSVARRRLPARYGDPPLSAAGLRPGSAGFAGAAGLAAARDRALTTGSICRWWSPSTSRWAAAIPSRAPSWARRWDSLRMRSPITPSASTASPRPSSAFWPRRWAFASKSKITPSACSSPSLLSLLSSAIYLFVSRFLLGLASGMDWLTELLRAVGNSLIAMVLFPAARPSADQGVREQETR